MTSETVSRPEKMLPGLQKAVSLGTALRRRGVVQRRQKRRRLHADDGQDGRLNERVMQV